MCLIVFKEDEKGIFTNRQFKTMIAKNDDGFGIMWRENGRVMVEKTMGSSRDKFKLFKKHRDKPQYAMHARIATHGLVDLNNCHPYKILNIDDGDEIDLYMMHNGTLYQAPEIDKTKSDTWHYVEYILKPLCKANVDLLWNSVHIQRLIDHHIGVNRLLFMRSDDVENPVLIFNMNSGKKETGCWLSNWFNDVYPKVHIETEYEKQARLAEEASKKTSTTHNFNGGSISKLIERKPETFNWEQYCKDRDELEKQYQAGELTAEQFKEKLKKRTTSYQTSLYERQGNLLLPKPKENDKIVVLKPHNDNPDDILVDTLLHLRGLSDQGIKEFCKSDPDCVTDIILALYEKNTMPYELIIQQINDKSGIDNVVNLLRHMIINEETRRKRIL